LVLLATDLDIELDIELDIYYAVSIGVLYNHRYTDNEVFL